MSPPASQQEGVERHAQPKGTSGASASKAIRLDEPVAELEKANSPMPQCPETDGRLRNQQVSWGQALAEQLQSLHSEGVPS